MSADVPEIMDVTPDNIDKTGFFCYMSKKKAEGYQRKLQWLKNRLAEGMRIKLLKLPERGFIEYMPAEYAWRPVKADGYFLIHCLWVVGKSKGKGFGEILLDACLEDAEGSGAKGVAMVTSGKVWMADKRIFEKHGFECTDTAPPEFSLMVKKFGRHPSPSFAGKWEEKAMAFGAGLTVVRTDQCPYIVDATNTATAAAGKSGIKSRVVELNSHEDIMKFSPSAYGTFGLVLDGKLLSYHYLLEKDLLPLLEENRKK